MPSWSIEDTRQLIQSQHGKTRLILVAPSLNSLADRQFHAQYHYQETQRILGKFKAAHLTNNSLLVVLHSGKNTVRDKYNELLIEIGAHTIAAVLAIHSQADLLAQAAYLSLGFDQKANPLPERSINAKSVVTRLNLDPVSAPIAAELKKLCNDPAFKHVSALANKSKHQNLICPTLNEDLTGQRTQRHELHFAAFRYADQPFPEATIESVLSPAYNLASRVTVDIGNMVNGILRQTNI